MHQLQNQLITASLNAPNIHSVFCSLACHDLLGDKGDFGEDGNSSKPEAPDPPPCDKVERS